MPVTYEETFHVFHLECDPWDRMTPGAMLRRTQAISTAHCEALGLTEAMYQRTNTVYLLAKISLEMGAMPGAAVPVRLETRAYGMRRAVYHRVTSLYGENGETLCEADSRWVLVDRTSHRILRKMPPEFGDLFVDEPGAEEHDMRLPKPAGALWTLRECVASYTLCDRNGHVNNANYADLVCDHLPLERLRKGLPRKMLLSYHAEIPLGHTFFMKGGTLAGDDCYFLAQSDEAKHFECAVFF